MRSGLIAVALVAGLALLWHGGIGQAQHSPRGLSNLPTPVRPERGEEDYLLGFGVYDPMPVTLQSVDPNGRWVRVAFEPPEIAALGLPEEAWIHVEQITLIAPADGFPLR